MLHVSGTNDIHGEQGTGRGDAHDDLPHHKALIDRGVQAQVGTHTAHSMAAHHQHLTTKPKCRKMQDVYCVK